MLGELTYLRKIGVRVVQSQIVVRGKCCYNLQCGATAQTCSGRHIAPDKDVEALVELMSLAHIPSHATHRVVHPRFAGQRLGEFVQRYFNNLRHVQRFESHRLCAVGRKQQISAE